MDVLDLRPVSSRAVGALIHNLLRGMSDDAAIRLAGAEHPGEASGLRRNVATARAMLQQALLRAAQERRHLDGGERMRIADRIARAERSKAQRNCGTCDGAGVTKARVSYGNMPVTVSVHCQDCAPAHLAGQEVDGL